MTQQVEAINVRGSTWQRWDPHIHAPGTALNDGYGSKDPWSAFLERVNKADPPIRVLGITDYCGIEGYIIAAEHHKAGRMPGVGLVFPNVEFRLTIETGKSAGVNLHLLFSPHDPDHVDRIKAFLSGLAFRHQDETFRCTLGDLIRLGRTFDRSLVDDGAAYREGVNQFKVRLTDLQDAFAKSAWVTANCLVAVAGGSVDGTSGLQGDGGQWAATRKNIERFADIIFTASPKQIAFYLGRGAATVEDLETKWAGRKPCLHGSDAHTADRVGLPDQTRRCWLNGDLTFETLRQAVIEPEGRVHIGEGPPQGALPGNTIRSVKLSDAPWMSPAVVPINAGMVAIIGARGSGKTALADFIALGAYGVSKRLSDSSFLRRADKYLKKTSAELLWENGQRTENGVASADAEELWDTPHLQYLSQQFVEKLCSSEGLDDALIAEIQRVVFDAHPVEERLDAVDFATLLERRMQTARDDRDHNLRGLARAAASINAELVRKDALPKLIKERDDTEKALKKDQADRKQLVPKGQEERAKQLQAATAAIEAKQRLLNAAQGRIQELVGLQNDVARYRQQDGPDWLVDVQERRAAARLSADDWKAFKLDFVGNVDALLKANVGRARADAAKLQGPAPAPATAGSPPPDPKVPLIPVGTDLSTQTLSLLNQERNRLQTLVGIDDLNVRRYKALTEKISKAEIVLAKQNAEIERGKKSDELLKELRATRRDAYQGIFAALIEEERELSQLYSPLRARIAVGARAVKKLSFSIRRHVDIAAWAAKGEQLLDLRRDPFRGGGELLKAADDVLGEPWRRGSAEEVATAMHAFLDQHAASLRSQRLANIPQLEWARSVSEWLYSTDHIQVGYGLRYDGVDIERLSPGTRGIVLLLLYLSIDSEDDRPLIIDQPGSSTLLTGTNLS
jgi:hypothetical protein